MSNEKTNALPPNATPTAEVRTKRRFSVIWLIPLIALAIGGWLAVKNFAEKGPLIKIHFETAEGLEAGKTKIKYKDVVIGDVEDITLADDIDAVTVLARMKNETKPYLNDKTRFWVVRAEISAGRISALGTLLSGAYIGIDPIRDGKKTHEFTGLEKQPQITADVPGEHFTLSAPTLGSLTVGSPIFYRQIKVGQVIDYKFNETGEGIDIQCFVNDPHHKLVNSATRFWNASGIDFKMDSSGIQVDTQSLISIIQGGIAFETPTKLASNEAVSENHQFKLYPSHDAAKEEIYTIKSYYLMYFDQSVRGLSPGAPVEFRGIPIGEVLDVKLIINADTLQARIPVMVMVEPERLEIWSEGEKYEYDEAFDDDTGIKESPLTAALHKQGLRAQLKTGNLLTGQLYIEMDFFPDLGPTKITHENGYQIFPTVPSALGQIAENVANVLKKIEKIPFEELGKNLNETIVTLKSTLEEFKGTADTLNQQVLPNMGKAMANINEDVLPTLDQTLVDLQETMVDLKKSLGSDSAINFKTQQTLDELTGAIRSVKSVADELDRNPRALIFGRGDAK